MELDAATERELCVLCKRRRIEARLQQRARVIVLAAQGLRNKDIAIEVDLESPAGRAVAQPLPAGRHRGTAAGCATLGPHAHSHVRVGVEDSAGDAAYQAGGGHALEHAHTGRWGWARPPLSESGSAMASSRTFKLSRDPRIKRDSFTSVGELKLAIDLYVAHHNAQPKPFIWTASAKDILAKVTRARAALAAASR